MIAVGYTRLDSEGLLETVLHGEYNTKQEAIDAAEALVQSSVSDTSVLNVLRGFVKYDDVIDYNVSYDIPR